MTSCHNIKEFEENVVQWKNVITTISVSNDTKII